MATLTAESNVLNDRITQTPRSARRLQRSSSSASRSPLEFIVIRPISGRWQQARMSPSCGCSVGSPPVMLIRSTGPDDSTTQSTVRAISSTDMCHTRSGRLYVKQIGQSRLQALVIDRTGS